MENLPAYITIGFGLTTALAVYLFYKATNNSKAILATVLGWLIIQGVIGLSGFYTVTDTIPPRLLLMLAPPMLGIIALLVTNKGRAIIDQWNLRWLNFLHVVRIPVELILLALFVYKLIPQLMTFEGRNFDILSGLSAPLR